MLFALFGDHYRPRHRNGLRPVAPWEDPDLVPGATTPGDGVEAAHDPAAPRRWRVPPVSTDRQEVAGAPVFDRMEAVVANRTPPPVLNHPPGV